jgi:transcriptional regulator
MYLPGQFEERRPELLQKLMRENGFATLITAGDGVPFATHIPVLIDGDAIAGRLRIRAHVARANPHWKQLGDGAPVLAIFHGPHAYVSPSWYAGEEHVPTWNYVAVHAYGRAALLGAPEARALLKDLVDHHERAFATPWRFDTLPAALVDELLGAVVGFEIGVDRLEGKLKLSQNRPPEDRGRVHEQLAASVDPRARDVAAWMDLLTAR